MVGLSIWRLPAKDQDVVARSAGSPAAPRRATARQEMAATRVQETHSLFPSPLTQAAKSGPARIVQAPIHWCRPHSAGSVEPFSFKPLICTRPHECTRPHSLIAALTSTRGPTLRSGLVHSSLHDVRCRDNASRWCHQPHDLLHSSPSRARASKSQRCVLSAPSARVSTALDAA